MDFRIKSGERILPKFQVKTSNKLKQDANFFPSRNVLRQWLMAKTS